MTDIRVTQIAARVLEKRAVDIRVTQLRASVLEKRSADIRVTQLRASVLRSAALVPGGDNDRRRAAAAC